VSLYYSILFFIFGLILGYIKGKQVKLKKNKKMNKEKLLKIINEEEEDYNFGGGEDSDGSLMKGQVNFNRIKKAIREEQK